MVLFSDASRIDIRALRRDFVLPVRLLAIGLPLTIVAGAVAGIGCSATSRSIEAVLLAIVLAPTDAALGQAVVTDPRVPARVRQGLNIESGLNDGICVPLLLIAIAIAEAEAPRSATARPCARSSRRSGTASSAACSRASLAALVVTVGVRRA